MMSLKASCLAVLVLAASSSVLAKAPTLMPGSKAPALEVKRWLKGAPVASIPSGVAVVEFWATWCGPCVESIPHVTKMAKEHPDAAFIGVSIWEDDGKVLDDFVARMGDKMDYHVGYSSNQAGMAKSWMAAADQNGIPCAFLLKDGVIQWIGHPMELDEPLEQVVKGSFDLEKAKTAYINRGLETARRAEVQQKIARISSLYDSGRVQEARTQLAELEHKAPFIKQEASRLRLVWLSLENPAAFDRTVDGILSSASEDDVQRVEAAMLPLTARPASKDLVKRTLTKAVNKAPQSLGVLYFAVYLNAAMQEKAEAARLAKLALDVMARQPDQENANLRKYLEDAAKG